MGAYKSFDGLSDWNRHLIRYTAGDSYPDYSKHQCMVGKHMTLQVTRNGVTLDQCIQPSIDNSDNIIGLVAGDEESYEVFKELFDDVINEQHKGFSTSERHPLVDLDNSSLIGGLLDERYVRSCRVRAGRNLRGFRLPPAISRAERRYVERLIVEAMTKSGLGGCYYPLSSITLDEQHSLAEDHVLFKKPTSHLIVNSGAVRDWPDARGIWHDETKNLLVWINEEDHIRVISMQRGGNMSQTFSRFCAGIQEIERLIKDHSGCQFMWNERLGYISTCPSNLGTGLRCSVHIQLKLLSQDKRFEKIIDVLGLEWRGTSGEFTEPVDSVYDISNWARLKLTERQFVQLVIDGVNKLIEMEQRLEPNASIDDLLPAATAAAAANF